MATEQPDRIVELADCCYPHQCANFVLNLQGKDMAKRQVIYEGSTKTVYEGSSDGTIILHFKDEIDGGKGTCEGKGILNNRLSAYLMGGMERAGLPTHLVRRLNMREQLVRSADMVPLRVRVRNAAAGSFAERLGLEVGEKLPRPIVEFFLKDSALGFPLVTEDQIIAFNWAGARDLDDIFALAMRANDFLAGVMLCGKLTVVDFAFEVGRLWENDVASLVFADELGVEAFRLRDVETGRNFGRDAASDNTVRLSDLYTEVAYRIGVLPKQSVRHRRPRLVS